MEEVPFSDAFGSPDHDGADLESADEFYLVDVLARAEFAQRCANTDAALQYEAILATLRQARRHPELYLGPRAATDPDDGDPEFAERAAVADLAVRLRLPENTIRTQALRAVDLQQRAPKIWTYFRNGDVSVGNATVVAEFAATLPTAVCSEFEEELLTPAQELPTPRFREKARRLRDMLDPIPLADRHEQARQHRRVWFEADHDGMCWINAHLPAHIGRQIMSRLDAAAVSLAAAKDETRTLDQLRADIAGDLLAGVGDSTTPVGVTVGVTVPVMTLLGLEELPGTLDGYGPIDPDTARRLAAHAPSFQRILTHPITGTVLDIDRESYRVPADLKRWTQMRDQHCVFPGCGRPAKHCDLDHTTAWEHGGPTRAANLAHLCRNHHRIKHKTRWKVAKEPNGSTTWTSPTGTTRTTDPPPF